MLGVKAQSRRIFQAEVQDARKQLDDVGRLMQDIFLRQ